jgi:hypothetical protein
MNDDRYTYHTYGMARVHLDEGVYTLKQLKDLVEALEQMNQHAKDSLKPMEKTQ